ncbi:MAG: T9SS type A sorting domain-containing protein [Bacteroidales bacterium]|nr:T9SS type A sorting domain-containing protein [Bacteroidales bacterium]MCF8390030.1 T9SS type A sorting domain-containing protein [Bacteroidales bacterium]
MINKLKPAVSFVILIILLFLTGAANNLFAQQIAFPGAEGYGRFARGGRGGDVYHVTNLNDGGPGSLRLGVEYATGPRTIVFDVSGTIMMNDRLRIEEPNITIAGQTAPGDGITLGNNSLYIYADNIIVRYIRVRYGDQTSEDGDAISVVRGKNIILDHVTASWSVDETLSCQSDEVDSLTVQWCMVTESLRYSHHEKGAHGYGGIIGSNRQTFHHNLYAHHSSRSPKVSGRRHCEVDFRNNVIYNWGYNNCYDGTKSYINWANNYYKPGPGTSDGVRDRIFQLSDAPVDPENEGWEISNTFTTSLYAEGNFMLGYPVITANNWAGGVDFDNGANEEANRAVTPAFNAPSITESTAEEAYPLVVAGAGASMVRDVIDKRIANEVLTGTTVFTGSVSGTAGIIDSQSDVGGWPLLSEEVRDPDFDKDRDGMADVWETENNLNPFDAEDRNDDRDHDGYTNLEEYLNMLILLKPVSDSNEEIRQLNQLNCYPNPSNSRLSVDLSDFGKSRVEIFNMLGQRVYSKNNDESVCEINHGDIDSGMYLVKVTGEKKQVISQRIIFE